MAVSEKCEVCGAEARHWTLRYVFYPDYGVETLCTACRSWATAILRRTL
jgi:hypothetical protein